jgi:hypothetical protein
MFILLSDRQVNGKGTDYRGASLAVKTACHWTRTRGRWCLCLYTIFALRLLGIIRSQRYLALSMSVQLIFTDTIRSKDIIYNLVIMRPTIKPSYFRRTLGGNPTPNRLEPMVAELGWLWQRTVLYWVALPMMIKGKS